MENLRDSISFILDDSLQKITWNTSQLLSPTTTLLQYLRSLPNHKGTKEGCAEGDCGACTVVIASVENHQLIYKAVNSCLIFLPQIHGKMVITVENLSHNNTLHPVQQAMVELDASQCGFCTPGFVMSMFALYKDTQATNDIHILDAFAGNLCRCTGYQSILNAAHSALKNKKPDTFNQNESAVISMLQTIHSEAALLETKHQKYYQPETLEQAHKYLFENPNAMLISGNSDVGLRVTKKGELLPLIVDISQIDALNYIHKTPENFKIGGNTSLNQVKDALQDELPILYKILSVFGSKQIRHVATLGGNIASASPIGDTIPVLMAYNAQLVLSNFKEKKTVNINEFITGYHQTLLQKDALIEQIIVPIPNKNIRIDAEKISKRTDLDISTVSAAMRLKLSDAGTIETIRLYFGGMAAFTSKASETEQFLMGKIWSEDTLIAAGSYLEKDFNPISDARAEAAGRMIFAKNLLLKFWQNSLKKPTQ
jgi:xanthine dehydrogenase small subunit